MSNGSDYLPQVTEDESAIQYPHPGLRQLDASEVKSIIQQEIQNAIGGIESQISEEQRQSIRMYYGRSLGNEVPERSQVVSRDVLEVIEWTMPSLMRMFTGGAQIVRFTERNPDGKRDAELATAYINYLWEHRLKGFKRVHDFFKTALMEKNGFLKVYVQEKRCPYYDEIEGITEDEIAAIVTDNTDLLSAEVVEDGENGPIYNISLRTWHIKHEVKIDGIPPEEMLVARRMVELDDDAPFVAQRKRQTVSDLVAMGFPIDEVASLPFDDAPEFALGRTERRSQDETYPDNRVDRLDVASRPIWTTDCYIRMDEDGDGYSELRKVLVVGDSSTHILEDVEIGWNPFVSATPVPMPHKFYGQSLSDLVEDIQVIRSTILRQILDHLYLSTNPRMGVVEGQVELEDLLVVRPGGLIRQRQPGMIEPVVLPPMPREAFEAFQYLEEIRANRTGIMAHGQEVDASAINSTATGLAQLMAEKQQKIELIARIFADSLKDLFKKLLRVVVEHGDQNDQIRVNGDWVKIDPRNWDMDMDLVVEVGLGAGQAIERIANLERVIQVQAQHVANGGLNYTVTPQNLWESAVALAEACGFRNRDLFFQNPAGVQPPEPPPNPDLKKIELQAQVERGKIQNQMAERELAAQKESNIVAHRRAELESQERTKMAEIAMRERTALGQQEATIEAARIAAESKKEQGSKTDGKSD